MLIDAFEKNFLKVCEELEKLNETFLIKGVPEEYKEIWETEVQRGFLKDYLII